MIFLAFLAALIAAANAQSCPAVQSNRVAFRLDDVQDFYLVQRQIEIIELFVSNGVPLSIGIIGSPLRFGNDYRIITYLRALIRDPTKDIEIVNHGLLHEDFATYSQQEQIDLLTESLANVKKILQIEDITTFIPPFNSFNDFTTIALRAAGFTHWSAQAETDLSRPYCQSNRTFYHFPIDASTNDQSAVEGFGFIGVPATYTMSKIADQIAIDGWSAVMMHPQEFATTNINGTLVDVRNETQWAELVSLVQLIKQSTYQLVTLGRLNIDGPNSTRPVFTGSSCNCVAFRLDNIQDFYLSNVQQAIIHLFERKKFPITLGIIASPTIFGLDAPLVTAVRGAVNDRTWDVEVAVNGLFFEDFRLYPVEYQTSLLTDARGYLQERLNVENITTFFPPYGAWDSDTLIALQSTGFTHMSSLQNFDLGPFYFKNQSIFRYPAGVSAGDVKNGYNYVMNQIDLQEKANGYATVVVYPSDFAIFDGVTYQNAVNDTMMTELERLLTAVQNATSYGVKVITQINTDAANRTRPAFPSCNCVAFRLDALQDYFLRNVQLAIMDAFNDSALTLGISGSAIGNDVVLKSYLFEALKTSRYEIANNGYIYADMSTDVYLDQLIAYNTSHYAIMEALNLTSITTLIPPYNGFNDDTILAVQDLNYTHFSSSLAKDYKLPKLSGQSFYRFPVGAYTSDLAASPLSVGVSASVTFEQITQQLRAVGFAGVQMTAAEFSVRDEFNVYQNIVNETMIQELRNLIQMVKDAGFRIVTIGRINNDSPSFTTGSFPTTGYSRLTTGRIVVSGGTTEIDASMSLTPAFLLVALMMLFLFF